ncbi:hypothetical protein RI129_003008 [Pyrocoelia pectoralis]|uniref:MADF domain-containing protein n=1 Tax=Pyrocoelia pectoralis TaxID=417401 RepID=A0AAN7VN17_9COLE
MATKEKDDERKFILECIEVYHSLPALRNIKSKDYSNRIKKNEQYNNLLRKYREYYPDADKAQLVKKFNSLRTNFRKELKRIKDSEKSGAGTDDIIEPTLWYFEEMKFLVGQEEPSTSQSTIQIQTHKVVRMISTICINLQRKNNEPPQKKRRNVDESAELISLAQKHLQEPQSEFDKIASAWAVELQKMKPQQQLFAKKAINDILFEGQMGSLHRDSIQINCLSRTSTPSTKMQPSPIYYDTLHAPSLISGHMGPLNGGNAGPSHKYQWNLSLLSKILLF